MKRITIGNCNLNVKDYYCKSDKDGIYYPNEECRLWLYINLTDVCNGSCPFCINPCRKQGESPIDVTKLLETLKKLRGKISGISITGGEPFLNPKLFEECMEAVVLTMEQTIEIDTVTNGTNFELIPGMRNIERLNSIHLSRHATDDEDNARIFGFKTPGMSEIESTINKLKDRGKIVLNCTLQKGYVDNVAKIAEYLEKAAEVGIENTSFIGLLKCNEYCEQYYVNPAEIELEKDERFHIWNYFSDYEYCRCYNGTYSAKAGNVRFYGRCPKNVKPAYTRQLVYTADNRLLCGFAGEEINI